MCLHNANRDQYITKKFEIEIGGRKQVFDPMRFPSCLSRQL
jgi:hypothetical protein